jgi:hypothetical protein
LPARDREPFGSDEDCEVVAARTLKGAACRVKVELVRLNCLQPLSKPDPLLARPASPTESKQFTFDRQPQIEARWAREEAVPKQVGRAAFLPRAERKVVVKGGLLSQEAGALQTIVEKFSLTEKECFDAFACFLAMMRLAKFN